PKTAIALLYSDEYHHAYDIRLKLTKEMLTVQKQDVICVGGSHQGRNHRTVTLRRHPVGGLGLSIKGGSEHNVPVVISKIIRGQAADQTGMLFVGDAVLQVNGINVENGTHEEVVHLLRNAGDEVTITVEYFREAPAFLKLPVGSPGPSSDHSSGASSPLFDSGLHLNRNSSNTWNAFEVLALDGVSSGILQFYTAQDGADWLQAVSANIRELTLQNIKMANNGCSASDQVVHMGWVNEKLRGTDSSQTCRPKFLALKGPSFYVFSSPPVSTFDWVRAERTYNLCEVLFKVHKFWLTGDCWLQANLYLGLQDFDFEDQRPYCFSVVAGHGKNHVFSVELGSELAVWEKSFQRAMFMEVQRTGSKTYTCSWQGEMLCFTVDFALGFTCFESKTKELEFQDLTAVLHCIHAFIAAKVASVDPGFMDSQSLARKYMYSN
uniref:Syntrophin gamma 2 n=1 Tax=Saimiri boliviensis boliviensis TaxID=39432 RepID=A0A2K6SQU4_SAIBB